MKKLKQLSTLLTAAQNKNFSEEAVKISSLLSDTSVDSTQNNTDIYEFKESDALDFEISRESAFVSMSSEEKKKKLTPRKLEQAITAELISPMKKMKKASPIKSETDKLKLVRREKDRDLIDKELIEAMEHAIIPLVPIVMPIEIATTSSNPKETPFDVLRKSPNFNNVVSPVKEEVKEEKKSVFAPIMTPSQPELFEEIKPVIKMAEKSDLKLENPATDFLNVQKIFDFEIEPPPKIEKPSIADKVLKKMNQHQQMQQQQQQNKPPNPPVLPEFMKIETKFNLPPFVTKSEPISPKVEPSTSTNLNEPPKIEVSHTLKKDIEVPLLKTKPVINSPEHKIDILDSISPKNNNLTETIEKLESVIQKSNMDRYAEQVKNIKKFINLVCPTWGLSTLKIIK